MKIAPIISTTKPKRTFSEAAMKHIFYFLTDELDKTKEIDKSSIKVKDKVIYFNAIDVKTELKSKL